MNENNKKSIYDSHKTFSEYQQQMIVSGVYEEMPDLYKDNGGIQWETPSNRKSGKFKGSHNKRRCWWVDKANEIGIDTNENKWISKVAKTIHPTGQRPCKVCGTILEIRYAYLSKNLINRILKIDFIDPALFELSEVTHILEFLQAFIDLYEKQALKEIPNLLDCKQFKKNEIEKHISDEKTILLWIDKVYIPQEPSMLSPGAMANPPDRLDGFHTYNRCCRSDADKGRSKDNLASYSTDRRAFENWSDGNWILANKLMGFINADKKVNSLPCALSHEPGSHLIPCSADHIGPISLGFSHRPEFQLLCNSCNSGKNNRMSYNDVQYLIKIEKNGENILTWYAQPIWDLLKDKVQNENDAKKLSKIMRDNRNTALNLLYEFLKNSEYLFLYTFLKLDLCDYIYTQNEYNVENSIITANYTKTSSNLKYVIVQKARKTRVAFESLEHYGSKENRNSFIMTNENIHKIIEETLELLGSNENEVQLVNYDLKQILHETPVSDQRLQEFINKKNYEELVNNPIFIEAKSQLNKIIEEVAVLFSGMWNDDRYTRE